MSPTTIYLVRHADVHNPHNIVYGRLPRFRLSEKGRFQAETAARWLTGRPVCAIYTSPQLRARQTAAIIAQAHPSVPVRVSQLLAEVKTGWQGESNQLLGREFNFYEPRRHPDDETIEDVFQRVDRLIRRLCWRCTGQQVVCVSHGDPIMIARTGYAGKELQFANIREAGYPERGSVTVLEFGAGEARPRLRYISLAQLAWATEPAVAAID